MYFVLFDRTFLQNATVEKISRNTAWPGSGGPAPSLPTSANWELLSRLRNVMIYLDDLDDLGIA